MRDLRTDLGDAWNEPLLDDCEACEGTGIDQPEPCDLDECEVCEGAGFVCQYCWATADECGCNTDDAVDLAVCEDCNGDGKHCNRCGNAASSCDCSCFECDGDGSIIVAL